MSRNSHDGPCAVSGQDIVGNPYWNLLAVDGIDRRDPEGNAALLLGEVGTLEVALRGADLLVGGNRVALLSGGDFFHERMLWRKHEVGGTVEGIGTSRKHRDAFLHTLHSKSHLGSLASADPVPLKKLDRLRPVEPLEIGDQALSIGRDPEHPLAHRATLHGESTHLTLPIDYFLICENGTEFRAPVHRLIRDEGKSHAIRITPSVG